MTAKTSRQSLHALPVIPVIENELDSDNLQKIMHTLRHFHLGNPTAAQQLPPLTDDYLPALLSAYRDASQLRYDYPLYLCPIDSTNTAESVPDEQLIKPLSDFLQESIESFAPTSDSAKVLKDNLPWIERSLGEASNKVEGPVIIKDLIVESCHKLCSHLQLEDDNQQRLQTDIDRLIESLPEGGMLLAYGRFPALHLLMHLIHNKVMPQLSLFKNELQQTIQHLQILLEVDDTKQEEASSSNSLKSNISSNQFFNTDSLSKVVKKQSRGSVAMSDSRRQRIKNSLQVLQDFKEKETLVHIIHANYSLDTILKESPCFVTEHHDDPCLRSMDVFDREAQELARVFAAVRIAKLEIKNIYDENIHDPWFDNFNWEAFSKKELILVPSVIVLESADRLADVCMVSFSHLLNSGRPVNIIARVQAHNNPGLHGNEDPFENYRTELGYFAISHRQAVVSQSSAARPQHLLAHLTTALNATRTSLHLINIGVRGEQDELDLNAWLVAGAALEGRAHPFFSVDPGAGDSAADRVDFSANPQADKDWPAQQFSYQNEAGVASNIELDFTFADYALLIPRLKHHFALVPIECVSDDLLEVADYLLLSADQIANFIPYVWAVNKHNELYRLVLSSALIHACRDRLNFWHTLQEMAGIRSRYIENAEARIHADAEIEVAKQVAQAKAEFDAELERVKTATAAEVMSRLTDMLLGMDLSTGSVRPVVAAPAPAAAEENVPAQQDEKAVSEAEAVEEEQESFEDPWIDSPLCTTCNDCTDMSPLMFVYNDTNQAYIADLSAGTYKQMVEAAEICPSNCIHPGKPWDDSEADLDDLLERAQPYN